MENEILIPSSIVPNAYYLGPWEMLILWILSAKKPIKFLLGSPCNGDGDPDLPSGDGNYRCGGE